MIIIKGIAPLSGLSRIIMLISGGIFFVVCYLAGLSGFYLEQKAMT